MGTEDETIAKGTVGDGVRPEKHLKVVIFTKKVAFQMSALNNKQMWLCDIMTRLRLIKYTEYDDGEIVAHLLESPVTGKPLDVWWWVESWPIVRWIFLFIWGSWLCVDKEAKQRASELVKLGWVEPKEDWPQ